MIIYSATPNTNQNFPVMAVADLFIKMIDDYLRRFSSNV
jgi:hypothetical protein